MNMVESIKYTGHTPDAQDIENTPPQADAKETGNRKKRG